MDHALEPTVFAYYHGREISTEVFLSHVTHARSLVSTTTQKNQSPRLMNLCADRYHFTVLFVAAMLEELITVMPANQSPGELQRLCALYPDMQLIDDTRLADICAEQQDTNSPASLAEVLKRIPSCQPVAELYTSGSTGTPLANLKQWGELLHGAQRVAARFALNQDVRHAVLATVPPQHMFGFEISVVLPLVAGVAVHHGKPFYPEDIARALDALPMPRILVTTPVHLKACVRDKRVWPQMTFILSSTAALPAELARHVTEQMRAPLQEIYGCSEVGAIATRAVNETDAWQLLGDFTLQVQEHGAQLSSKILAQPLALNDQLEILAEGKFRLVGRAADLIKIGGKRGSLAEISLRIKSMQGVEDAVVFLPSTQSDKRERLVALVVASNITPEQIRQRLSCDIDAVFVPRQIYIVANLPYSTSGKLPRAALLAALAENRGSEQAC